MGGDQLHDDRIGLSPGQLRRPRVRRVGYLPVWWYFLWLFYVYAFPKHGGSSKFKPSRQNRNKFVYASRGIEISSRTRHVPNRKILDFTFLFDHAVFLLNN